MAMVIFCGFADSDKGFREGRRQCDGRCAENSSWAQCVVGDQCVPSSVRPVLDDLELDRRRLPQSQFVRPAMAHNNVELDRRRLGKH